MSKTPFLARLGAAFAAFTGGEQIIQRGSLGAFDQIPLLGGSAGDKISQPYGQSVWVQAAIKKIAKPISAVPLKFRLGETEITSAPWLEFWQQPLSSGTRGDFIDALTGWLKLAGEAFIIVQPDSAKPFPEQVRQWPPLMLARPDCMKAVKADAGQLIGWEYRNAKGDPLKLAVEQVIQPKYWNPYDDYRGMSEYEAARVATEADYLAGKFALNIARANGDTGIIIALKGGAVPDDAQRKQIIEQLRMKQERSRRGEFASIFLPADLEVQDPKVRAPDAQFVAQRIENRHEIAIAFDVPPSMFEVMQSYSIGSASAWYQLITDACIPTGVKIAEAISEITSRMAGQEIEAFFDWDEHPVMQSVRRERIDAWTKLVDRGMPGELASDALDLDLPNYPAGKVGLIPFSLAPFGETEDPAQDKQLAEPAPDAVQEALAAIRAAKVGRQPPGPPVPGCNCCAINFAALEIKATDSQSVKLWKSHAAKRRATLRAYESKFTAVLMTARREVLRKIENAGAAEARGPATKAAAADFLFNFPGFEKLFRASMRSAGLNALQTAGDQLFAELKRDDPWKMPQAETLQFLRARENKLDQVPQDIFDRIKVELEAGLNAGESMKKLADRVRGEFNEISEGRAKVVASTETAAAYGHGRHLAMKEAGIQWKQWLTSGSDNVRAAHEAMNGVREVIEEPFLVINPTTGETDHVMHPAESSGAAWNVINCHCVEIAIAVPEETETT